MDRRTFLQTAAVASLSVKAMGTPAESQRTRSLAFVHTHTGERVSETYFDNGDYVVASLNRIHHLLRDFRTDEVHAIDVRVLDILHDLQALTGHEAPYEIISGYRSPQTNAALRRNSTGVAEHSFHMQGRAIDVRLSGYATRELHDLARTLGRGGVGFYPHSDFIHLDSGPVRFW